MFDDVSHLFSLFSPRCSHQYDFVILQLNLIFCVVMLVFFLFSQVTLLFPLFHEHAAPQRVQDGEAEPQLILRDINDYNRRFSGQPRSVSKLNLTIYPASLCIIHSVYTA